jgi:hypothetical protein
LEWIVTVGGNIVLFEMAGLIISLVVRRPLALLATALLLTLVIIVLSSWASGFSLTLSSALALIVALAFYASLVVISIGLLKANESGSQTI